MGHVDKASRAISAGNNFARKGEHSKALQKFDEGIRAGADWAEINRGNSLEALGRLEEAAESFRRAIELGDFDAKLNLALILSDLRHPEAESMFHDAHKSGDPRALPALAWHFWIHGDRVSARAVSGTARQVESDALFMQAVETVMDWQEFSDVELLPELEKAAKIFPGAEFALNEYRTGARG